MKKKDFWSAWSLFKIVLIAVFLVSGLVASPANANAAGTIFNDGFEATPDGFINWTSNQPEVGNWTVDNSGHTGKAARVKGDNDETKTLYKEISTAGWENITVSYWYMAEVSGSGVFESTDVGRDDIYVEWWDGSVWHELLHLVGPAEEGWVSKVHNLPAEAADNNDFRLRFRISLTAATESIYIDDVSITGDKTVEELANQMGLPAETIEPFVENLLGDMVTKKGKKYSSLK